MDELAALLARFAPTDGIHETPVPGLCAIRASEPGAEFAHALHHPAVCLVVQGEKRVLLQGQAYDYDATRVMVFSVDLPISATVTKATRRQPYLCLRMDIDAREVADLLAGAPVVPQGDDRCGLFVTPATPALLDAATRLMRLAQSPADVAVLAPLARREILYRLLLGTEGHRLAQIGRGDSSAGRVMQAIAWLKTHFAQPLQIEALSRHANMSASSLHHQFKAVTAMSPLQYQKQLRLQEARRLLLAGFDAAGAGHAVGYESSSQFSREYARQFGAPPARDAQRLREQSAA